MGTHMKTTIEISDALFRDAKALANRERITLRVLVEEGLRHVVTSRRGKRRAFRLRDASVDGEGLQPGLTGAWEQLRELVYQGHGT